MAQFSAPRSLTQHAVQHARVGEFNHAVLEELLEEALEEQTSGGVCRGVHEVPLQPEAGAEHRF